MHFAEENFGSVCQMINELQDKGRGDLKRPPFSMHRMMATLWRRIVFNPIRCEIHDIILKNFALQRKRIGEDMEKSVKNNYKQDPSEYVLIKYILYRAIQAVTDLSIDEFSLHFVLHSQFIPEIYFPIHTSILSLTSSYYSSLSHLPRAAVSRLYTLDLHFLQRICLPCTVLEAFRLRLHAEQSQLLTGFVSDLQVLSLNCAVKSEAYPLVHSEFGRTMLGNTSLPRLKQYLDYLAAVGRLDEVDCFNALVQNI
jgi:hypothetical protein